ncbi:MAG: phospholipid scramblase-related protein [Deltaproteobacteria bacterium]|nr:phospholipid scramblase-related protein [Deltaproteobacteria bacterium]
MSESLMRLQQSESLVVQQKKEWGEILSGWETRNRYQITSPDGVALYHAGEVGSGALAVLTRGFLKNKRPFTMEMRDAAGAPAFKVVRPWTWFFSECEIVAPDGSVLGKVDQRWAWFNRRFTVYDRRGVEVAEIFGPLFHPWTFQLKVGEQEVGKITKKWSGLLKEAFTDSDNFMVHFGPQMDQDLRLVLLGATFLIDFLYFENRE